MNEQHELFLKIEVWRRVKNVRRWMNHTKQPCELITHTIEKMEIEPNDFNVYTDEKCFKFYRIK